MTAAHGIGPLLAIAAVSGFYTSLWGAFKDSPWEGFKPRTFPRSVLFSFGIVAFLFGIPVLRERIAGLGFVGVFFLVMGIERFLAELYKGFFRKEPQEKYFVPSRITLLGRPVTSEAVRLVAGVVLVSLVFLVLFLGLPVRGFLGYLVVAYLTGLLVAGGGAYKDAPFEGFMLLRFQRSGVVLAVLAPLFWWLAPDGGETPLGLLIYMNGGLERFVVEYYKTYIKRNMSGKFRPDLPRVETRRREELHYAALGIIALVAVMAFLD